MERTGYGDAITAREAQVVGDGPRIDPLDDSEMTGDIRDVVNRVRNAIGAGDAVIVPEYMRTMVRHPELFQAQMDLGTVLFKGRIPARERELAVLRVGWLAGAPYEYGEHVKIAQRCGVTLEEIARAKAGSSAPGWSAHDAAILRGVEELLADFTVSDATWDSLAKTWDDAQLAEYPSMVGQYVATAYIQNALRIRLSEGNKGLGS